MRKRPAIKNKTNGRGMYATRTSDNAEKNELDGLEERLSNSQDLHLIMVTVLMFLSKN